jgi:hypothetical protein
MKKLTLLIIFITIIIASNAQQRVLLDLALSDLGVKTQYHQHFSVNFPQKLSISPVQTKFDVIDESIIGTTWYDLQSNKLLQNRIHAFEDGTIGAVWTRGIQATSFPDRGTGYNYYDGSGWGSEPEGRLESIRAGWPSYAPWGENGEIVSSHDFATSEIYLLTREDKGTGDWNEDIFSYSSGPPELSWPRITTSGENRDIVHLLANSVNEYEGQPSAVVYSRSVDGGETWETENIIIDGMGSDDYFEIAADEYVWAEPNGGAIAFLVASAWHDLFMMKSTDDGETWEKTVIWEHPYPFFNWDVTITDTFFCVDNSASIALDNNGNAHVVFGINRVLHSEPGTSYFLFPYVDGIGYWHEEMETFSNDLSALAPPGLGYEESELVEDYNYIGWTQDVDGDGEITFVEDIMYYRELGVSTMPTIAIDDDEGIIYVAWASTTETYDNIDFNFKKIWSRAKWIGGTWGPFDHLTENIVHIFDETIYPVLAPVGYSGEFDLIMNADGMPGTALDEEHDYVENRIIHLKVTPPSIGIEESPGNLNSLAVTNVYPNPVTDKLWLEVALSGPANVEFRVMDMTGRVLEKFSPGFSNGGHRTYSLNLERHSPGILVIQVNAGGETISLRVLKR